MHTKETIHYFAMKRSGSHAIIHFIFRLYDDPKAFFAAQVPRRPTKPHKYWTDPDSKCIVPEGFYELEEKELALLSYEDPKMDAKLQMSFDIEHGLFPNEEEIIGKSKKVIPILSIRDPFNMFASRFKDHHYVERKNPRKRQYFRDMWKAHAKEYLGITNFLPPETIKINFNRWFSDTEYRKWIADSLQKPFEEEGWNHVTKEGNGSSFNKRKFGDSADKMPLEERWRDMMHNANYKLLFRDKEMVELSERIFGHIKGTEKYINEIKYKRIL